MYVCEDVIPYPTQRKRSGKREKSRTQRKGRVLRADKEKRTSRQKNSETFSCSLQGQNPTAEKKKKGVPAGPRKKAAVAQKDKVKQLL